MRVGLKSFWSRGSLNVSLQLIDAASKSIYQFLNTLTWTTNTQINWPELQQNGHW